MAMPRADVHNQRIRRACGARQRLAETRIHRLSNHVFDNGSMWSRCGNSHNLHTFDRISLSVNKYLAISSNIYHLIA
jgi:hypothetical protein